MQRSFTVLALAPLRHTMLNRATMIIACPACSTRYVVPDSAIGVDGRTVRCAKCKHNWFQDGPQITPPPAAAPVPAPAPPPAPAPEPEPQAEPEPQPEVAAAIDDAPQAETASPPSSGWNWAEPAAAEPAESEPEPEAEPAAEPEPAAAAPVYAEPAYAEPAYSEADERRDDEVPVPPVYSEPVYHSAFGDYDETSQFDHQPLLAPRRNPAKMWMMAAVLFATVSIAAIGATAWYGLPDWMPFAKPVFAEDQPGLKLEFPPRQQQRYQLPNGTWYLSANGTVTNISQNPRSIPGILIVLRDSKNRIVHMDEVRSPKRVLAPGERVEISEALVPVPKAGTRVEFGWKPN